jgi:hypothetical protein
VGTLASSNVRPRPLELSVELYRNHSISTNAAEQVMVQAWAQVQNLHLLDRCEHWIYDRAFQMSRLPKLYFLRYDA